MNKLVDICCESIRKNWKEFNITSDNPYYDILWETFENKFNIDRDNIYLHIFKKFIKKEEIDNIIIENRININKENSETLTIKGLHRLERKNLHLFCNNFGLHHESKTNKILKKNRRVLYIYMPNIWSWEYTEKNPYSKFKEELENKKKDIVLYVK